MYGCFGCFGCFPIDLTNLYIYQYHPLKSIPATLPRKITSNTRNNAISPCPINGLGVTGPIRNGPVPTRYYGGANADLKIINVIA